MPQKQVNTFFSYDLSVEEEEVGQVFTLEQKRVLQNKLSSIAQDKLNLPFTPNDIATYTQREAELAGQIGIIQWLLDTSQQVEDAIAVRLSENSNQ